jgi:hypothetical protein
MASPKHRQSVGRVEDAEAIEFARMVERGLREDLERLHVDLMEEESRLTTLEDIRRHSMGDFEALSEQGVTTVEAALYYTLFHHLTREITIQGRLVINARHRVGDKQAAARAAAEDRRSAERVHGARDVGRVRPKPPALSVCVPCVSVRPALKKAS